MLARFAHGRLERHVDRVAFWRTGEIDNGLCNRQFALGTAKAFLYIPGGHAQRQRTRVGIADIFTGHAHHAARQIQWVTATVDHPRKPVQGRVGIGTTNRLVQCRYLVVERLAALVEAASTVTQQALQQPDIDFAAVFGQVRGVLQQVEHAPTVAIGGGHQNRKPLIAQGQLPLAQPALFGQGTIDQLAQRRLVQAFEHVDTRPGQQGVVELERGVFGGRADKDQRAVLDVRQEGILL